MTKAMKKTFFLAILLGIAHAGFCQPQFNTLSFPNSVNLFDKFEVSFTLGSTYSNPYDSAAILIKATFRSPDGINYTIDAFYYEDYSFQNENGLEIAYAHPENNCWKIRFTPKQVGNWYFSLVATDENGTSVIPYNNPKYYTFTCNSVNNANGFISVANSRYLKREVIANGQRLFKSFFPIGPNVAWYNCYPYYEYNHPVGIYNYKRHIDSLSGNANYMRIFLNRYETISLYGPEYTQYDGNNMPIVYFDSIVNQKDSAELDYIIDYAAQHGVTVNLCLFSYGDFSENPEVVHSIHDSTTWHNNPFNFIISNPYEFFDDDNAKKITKNLIRYIVSRWGYATNIVCWELWNEVSNMFKMCNDDTGTLQQHVLSWHNDMAHFIRKHDPYKHCVSTSMGTLAKTFNSSIANHNYPLFLALFDTLDIVQQHNYPNIQKAKSAEQVSKVLLDSTTSSHMAYPTKPFFMEEFGFGQGKLYMEKDSCGIDLHNSLWSSLFSTAIGPASLWWWSYLKDCHLFHNRYSPLLTFCQNLPILSETFTAHQTGQKVGHKLVFPNNLQIYYMINATEDTIYGWCQDTAFAYQSLRWLTDSVRFADDTTGYALYAFHFVDSAVFDPDGYVYTLDLAKRPEASFNSNIIDIPIFNQPVRTTYRLDWYNTETGLPYFNNQLRFAGIMLNNQGNKVLRFIFPSEIRNLNNNTITNTFGDAVFVLTKTANNPSYKN